MGNGVLLAGIRVGGLHGDADAINQGFLILPRLPTRPYWIEGIKIAPMIGGEREKEARAYGQKRLCTHSEFVKLPLFLCRIISRKHGVMN